MVLETVEKPSLKKLIATVESENLINFVLPDGDLTGSVIKFKNYKERCEAWEKFIQENPTSPIVEVLTKKFDRSTLASRIAALASKANRMAETSLLNAKDFTHEELSIIKVFLYEHGWDVKLYIKLS